VGLIFSSKANGDIIFMLPDALYKIGCNTDIQCAMLFIGENVDSRLFHYSSLNNFWCDFLDAGSSPA